MFCYLPIVPAVYVLLLNNCTGSLSFVTHRIIRVICCIWYVYDPDPIPVKNSVRVHTIYTLQNYSQFKTKRQIERISPTVFHKKTKMANVDTNTWS